MFFFYIQFNDWRKLFQVWGVFFIRDFFKDLQGGGVFRFIGDGRGVRKVFDIFRKDLQGKFQSLIFRLYKIGEFYNK